MAIHCHPERAGAQATASRRIPLPAKVLPTKVFFDTRLLRSRLLIMTYKKGRPLRPPYLPTHSLFRLRGLLRSRWGLVSRRCSARRARVGAGRHRAVRLYRCGLSARRRVPVTAHRDPINHLAITRVRLRDALGRLLFFSGRDRSRKFDGRIGNVHVDTAAREQRLALEFLLDGALQARGVTRRGLVARGQAAGAGSGGGVSVISLRRWRSCPATGLSSARG